MLVGASAFDAALFLEFWEMERELAKTRSRQPADTLDGSSAAG
jgi:hypothetical protein